MSARRDWSGYGSNGSLRFGDRPGLESLAQPKSADQNEIDAAGKRFGWLHQCAEQERIEWPRPWSCERRYVDQLSDRNLVADQVAAPRKAIKTPETKMETKELAKIKARPIVGKERDTTQRQQTHPDCRPWRKS